MFNQIKTLNVAKYFIDCNFLDGRQKESFPISLFRRKTPPTIDIISISITSEYNEEYYAILRDFNLKEAWYNYRLIDTSCNDVKSNREYWVRENTLRLIWDTWIQEKDIWGDWSFTYKNFKKHLKKYGKSNAQIENEIKDFILKDHFNRFSRYGHEVLDYKRENPIVFYSHNIDYNWVAFRWLFNNFPAEFPMGMLRLHRKDK